MKIWATSCLHLSGPSTDTEMHARITASCLHISQKVEAVILAGDIVDDHPDIHWPWLAQWLPNVPIVVVEGNHDSFYYEPCVFPPRNWVDLNAFGSFVDIGDIRIAGFKSPNFPGPPWAVHHPIEMLTDSEVYNLNSPHVLAADILVCHHPFFYSLGGTHCCDPRLLKLLSHSSISDLVFGHVHPEFNSYLPYMTRVPAGGGSRLINLHHVSRGVLSRGLYIDPFYYLGDFK